MTAMSTYDNIFFKHFYENFDFENCMLIFDDDHRLVKLINQLYVIELYYTLVTCKYIFCIKDKKIPAMRYSQKINKYAKQLIGRVNELKSKLEDKKEKAKIAELNKFLESLHS